MPIEADIVGKWNFQDSENFDEYLKEVGVGWTTRTIASKTKPTLEFSVKGDEWTMNSNSTFKNYTLKWKLGTASDDKTADGRDVSSVFTIENDRLIQNETGKNGGKDSRIERFIEGGKLKIVCTCNGVSCTRTYVKA